jgi:hypothetical protein
MLMLMVMVMKGFSTTMLRSFDVLIFKAQKFATRK